MQKNSIEKSVHGDVGCVRNEFQNGGVDKISRVSVHFNLADPLTTKDSVLTDAL